MNRYFPSLLLILVLITANVTAQNHFIYIQSETTKPFAVTVNDKQYQSTGTGYVIIPRLKNGEYSLVVKYKDLKIQSIFTTVIDKKDVGYTLRDLGNNIGLVNMQTFATLAATPVELYAKNDKTTINDKVDVDKKATSSIKKPVTKKDPSTTSIVRLKQGVNKISEIQSAKNISLLFIDVQGSAIDTIDVVIPAYQDEPKPAAYYTTENNSLFKWASTGITLDEENSLLYQEGYNTKCVHLLTKEDYNRLRKRMSSQSSEDKMIEEAVKISKLKCFTTQQVKNLSTLFIKEQGKYKFFDALYHAVYDYIEYPVLEKELQNDVYISRFKALVGR